MEAGTTALYRSIAPLFFARFAVLDDISGKTWSNLFSTSGTVAIETAARGFGKINLCETDKINIATASLPYRFRKQLAESIAARNILQQGGAVLLHSHPNTKYLSLSVILHKTTITFTATPS